MAKPETFRLWDRLRLFTEEGIRSATPKNASGVYIIYKNFRPFYVGCSKNNIKGRLQCHYRGDGNVNVDKAVKARCRMKFTWGEVMSYQQFEALLIKEFGGSMGSLGNLRNETDPADRF